MVIGEGANKDEVIRWAGARLGFDLVFDRDQAIANELGITSYPYIVGLDRRGIVRVAGPIQGDDLETIASLLADPADSGRGAEREVNEVDTHLDGRVVKDEPEPVH